MLWLSTHYLPHKKSTMNSVSNCRAAGVGGSSSFLTFLLTVGSDGAGCLGPQKHWALLRERDFEYLQGRVLHPSSVQGVLIFKQNFLCLIWTAEIGLAPLSLLPLPCACSCACPHSGLSLHEIPICPSLQPAEVPAKGSTTICSAGRSSPPCIFCELTDSMLCLVI